MQEKSRLDSKYALKVCQLDQALYNKSNKE